MDYQHKTNRGFSFLLSPGGILIGYILTLFAVVAGVGAYPASPFWLALLFVVLGTFLVFAVTVLVIVYLFFFVAVLRGVTTFGRKLFLGTCRSSSLLSMTKHSVSPTKCPHKRAPIALWDRWIDDAW